MTDIREAEQAACPNCGSPARKDRYYGKAEWVCLSHGYGADYIPQTTEACELIRSLREELDEANRDLLEWQHEWLVAGRDAERDRIADWLENTSRKLLLVGLTSTADSYEQARVAIRNNAHRSDT